MILPVLNSISSARDTTSTFLGYYDKENEQQGTFTEMENLSGDKYPMLATRERRCRLAELNKATGLHAKAQLAWCAGGKLYYEGRAVADVNNEEKKMVSMGAYLLVWPDKIMLNTATGEVKALGARWQSVGNVGFSLSRLDDNDYTYYTGLVAPDPEENIFWMDTGKETHVLKMWNSSTDSWDSVGTTYVKISADGIGAQFAEYDAVTISGCKDETFNISMAVFERGDDYIKVAALIDANFTQTEEDGSLVVERVIPDMEYLTECNNRVWGCNSEKNEIYACKLGDPTNWNCFLGLVDDSYSVTVGSDGAFTGAVTHLGYVLFFKEDCIHKIYGTMPSNFSATYTNCRGVQKGSEKSLLVVNETLYYKSRNDICVYDGSLPTSISEALGTRSYYNAVAGALNGKYYISMCTADGKWNLFVFDAARGTWFREDGFHAIQFATMDGDLFGLDSDGVLWCMNGKSYFYEGQTVEMEEELAWSCTTGPICTEDPDAKYVQRIQIRIKMPEGSLFQLAVEYDGDGVWHQLCSITNTANRCFTVPVVVRRCDQMRLKLSGRGEFILFSMSKVMSGGSEVK